MLWSAEPPALPLVAPAVPDEGQGDGPPSVTEGPPRRPQLVREGPTSDTTYGRLDGDLSVVVGAGATLGPRAPRVTADLRFRYLDTVGLFATYEDAAGGAASPRRVVAGGLEVRPLFLARWLRGWHGETTRITLAIDSLGLEVGAFVPQPPFTGFASRPGAQVGLGLEVPVLTHASGPWIGFHGGVRFGYGALAQGDVARPDDRALFLSVTLAWHQFFGAHVADAGDGAPR